MQVSINSQSMFSSMHQIAAQKVTFSGMYPSIICKSSSQLETVPVFKSCGFPANIETLDFHWIQAKLAFFVIHKMEAIDECLLITNIEISCWEEQLRQAVS